MPESWLAVRSTDMPMAIAYEKHYYDSEGNDILSGFHRRYIYILITHTRTSMLFTCHHINAFHLSSPHC
jgi:hypothetical protein